ncbi:MAG: selenocysteine-specific translation elongation factor [Betaproteobacteria bacterium]|nr:selenocysteine-specific translation elongation factor [Betaproteobacteria bacterium]
MLIGTAGHIDHGKTTLVRALTGVDTDRLPEEKARGISIELGYAFQPLADGGVLGFIDVPGHERLIHTMLAGAAGIDFGLLVVAADDGVMPQTREHLAILQLLGIRRGAVALTKVDRVASARCELVRQEIAALLADTPFAAASVFCVAPPLGQGVAELRAHLEQAATCAARQPVAAGFRLAVDRCFTLAGVGTVVTGTVFDGEVRVGERLRLSPGGQEVRVRSVHAQGRAAAAARAGERCALGLAGIARDEVGRGDWVLAPALHGLVGRLDVRLFLLPSKLPPLKQWSRVHIHHGARHEMAHVLLLDKERLGAGEEAFAQLVFDRPMVLCAGDALILRDASATQTLGGARALDPDPPLRQRRSPVRLAQLAALDNQDAAAALAGVLPHAAWGIELRAFLRARNRALEEQVLESLGVRIKTSDADWLLARGVWEALLARISAALDAFHQRTPDQLGPDLSRLRRIAAPACAAPVFAAAVESLIESCAVVRSGPWLHRPDHDIRLNGEETRLAELVLPRIVTGSFDPPWVRDLAQETGAEEAVMRNLLIRLARRGELFQVVRDLFYSHKAIIALARVVSALAGEEGGARAADFRDRTGLGRKRAIQILEFFDRIGYTRRTKEAHRLRSDSLLHF